MFNWLHNYYPQSEIFTIGGFSLHWYGLMIAIGAGIGVAVVVRLAKIYGIDRDFMYNLIFYVIVFGLLFDRGYYIIYNWQYYSQNLVDIPKIWEGGLAIHGAIIGGLLVILYFARKYKVSGWLQLDLLAIGLLIGLGFGRWGNYFNQELFGTPTNLPWGIPIEPQNRPEQFAEATHFHPTFLYESMLDFILAGALIWWHRVRSIKKSARYGLIGLTALGGYGAIRLLTEYFRTDFSPYFFGFRVAQIASFVIILSAVILFIYVYRTAQKKKLNEQP